ncbi:LytR/AlgR family response regulator transcription factor [Martelella endophytica]|uniref:Two-component response regulator protein n=1 Tax=Martelella endophytica TaxID=1486262 RepID=A0A0D5LTM2_MAREN|nr:LytTR family DNA-binding domain-containing protein [Martelella endophytica]AJY47112.1 two-component response regulator protein [Martelella endophytica]
MPRVILVDDEPPARRGLTRMLSAFEDIEIIGEAGSVDQARALIASLQPDAVFLDIELTSGKGFDIVRDLSTETAVIVVTAYSLYAIDAFDVAALDFLVKPVEPERLETAINRLRERLAQQTYATSPGPRTGQPARILLKSMMSSVMVSIDTITLLQAEADFTRVHLDNNQTYLAGGLLGKFEADLPSPPFCRLSRSLIVNLDQIGSVEWESGGRSNVRFASSDHTIPLGRSATKRLRQLLGAPAS